jgi:hypothetical protein
VDQIDDVNSGELTENGVSYATFLRIELVMLGAPFSEKAL